MPSDINETIAEVLRLDAKATPGPWVRTRTGATMAVAGCGGSRGGVYTLAESAYPSMSADLIAYYRTAAPVLAREVQRLQGHTRDLEALLVCHRLQKRPPNELLDRLAKWRQQEEADNAE